MITKEKYNKIYNLYDELENNIHKFVSRFNTVLTERIAPVINSTTVNVNRPQKLHSCDTFVMYPDYVTVSFVDYDTRGEYDISMECLCDDTMDDEIERMVAEEIDKLNKQIAYSHKRIAEDKMKQYLNLKKELGL